MVGVPVADVSSCIAQASTFRTAVGVIGFEGTKLTLMLSMNKLIWLVAKTSASDTLVILAPDALKGVNIIRVLLHLSAIFPLFPLAFTTPHTDLTEYPLPPCPKPKTPILVDAVVVATAAGVAVIVVVVAVVVVIVAVGVSSAEAVFASVFGSSFWVIAVWVFLENSRYLV